MAVTLVGLTHSTQNKLISSQNQYPNIQKRGSVHKKSKSKVRSTGTAKIKNVGIQTLGKNVGTPDTRYEDKLAQITQTIYTRKAGLHRWSIRAGQTITEVGNTQGQEVAV